MSEERILMNSIYNSQNLPDSIKSLLYRVKTEEIVKNCHDYVGLLHYFINEGHAANTSIVKKFLDQNNYVLSLIDLNKLALSTSKIGNLTIYKLLLTWGANNYDEVFLHALCFGNIHIAIAANDIYLEHHKYSINHAKIFSMLPFIDLLLAGPHVFAINDSKPGALFLKDPHIDPFANDNFVIRKTTQIGYLTVLLYFYSKIEPELFYEILFRKLKWNPSIFSMWKHMDFGLLKQLVITEEFTSVKIFIQKTTTHNIELLKFAANNNYPEICALLVSEDNLLDPNIILLSGAQNGHIDLCRYAIELKATKIKDMMLLGAQYDYIDICKLAKDSLVSPLSFEEYLEIYKIAKTREIQELLFGWGNLSSMNIVRNRITSMFV